jgi:DNA-binding CsgD family transcriptional regulator
MQNLNHLWADKSSLIKFFADAPSMDIPSRMKYFHDIFPYAESLPVNFYIYGMNDVSIACNQMTLTALGHDEITEYVDLFPEQYARQRGWPRTLVDNFIENNHFALSEGSYPCQEMTLHGDYFKKWATQKNAIYDDNGRPVGIIGVTILNSIDNQYISWDAAHKRVSLKLSGNILVDLSVREFSVLQGVLQGGTANEIAFKEFLSPKTVETYLMRIKVKFQCEKIRDLISLLIKEELAKDVIHFRMK